MKLQIYTVRSFFPWVDAFDREEEFIRIAADYNKTTEDEIRKMLNDNKNVSYSTSWSDMIRSLSAQERLEKTLKPAKRVTCDCGHVVFEGCSMSTGRGTSCSGCYDRMSR